MLQILTKIGLCQKHMIFKFLTDHTREVVGHTHTPLYVFGVGIPKKSGEIYTL